MTGESNIYGSEFVDAVIRPGLAAPRGVSVNWFQLC